MSDLVLLVKREGIDKQWQVAPYPIPSRERGERLAKWLQGTGMFKNMTLHWRIVSTEQANG